LNPYRLNGAAAKFKWRASISVKLTEIIGIVRDFLSALL